MNVYLVDLSNLAYRSLHSNKLTTKDGRPSGHIYSTIVTLQSLVKRDPGMSLVFALDMPPTRKLSLFPAYKANRKDKAPRYNPVPDVHRLIRLMRCRCIWADGEEADDVIASYCKFNSHEDITIVSSDSDLFQLIGGGVRQLDPLKGRYIIKEDLERKFNLSDYKKVVLWKTIFGDSGDGIKPPIPRLIKKPLIKYIEDCDGTVDGFLSTIDKDDKAVKKIIESSTFHRDATLNNSLVKLNDEVFFLEKRHRGNLAWLCHLLDSFECKSLITRELEVLV